jgi:serine/threonine protein kinase
MFSLLVDVIEGLSEMHRQGFVHSDIKPANIMLGRDNGNAPFHAVISDFGIAQIVSNRALLVSAFQISKFQGLSVNYAAPELVARIINPQLA